ncbi:MAG: carboxypeptidase regulatory-like domain-containing protein [Chitinophagaceae bacterium]|nr:carboxypeptidase regulatory-like domain-containing protein [Chitinophagaceae bacterium]
MKRSVLLLFAILAYGMMTAQKLSELKTYDTMTYIYKLDAEQVRFILQSNTIYDTSILFTRKPQLIPRSVYKDDTLGWGNFIIATIYEHDVSYRYLFKTPLSITPKTIGNDVILFLSLKKEKTLVKYAKLFLDGKEIKYDPGYGGYSFPASLPDKERLRKNQVLLRIQYGGETYYMHYNYSPGYTPSEPRNNPFTGNQAVSPGYFLLDKPLYKPLDTMKLKAYLVKPNNGKPVRRKVHLNISEPLQNYTVTKKLKKSGPGVYLYEWPVPDTLKLDRNYSVQMWYSMRNTVFSKSKNFRIEEYILNKNKYDMYMSSDIYFAGDDIAFYVSAQDINGFPITGARVHYTLRIQDVLRTFTDTLTLSAAKRNKFFEGDTVVDYEKFMLLKIPSGILPKMNANYILEVTITDPNTFERLAFTKTFLKYTEKEKLLFYQQRDSLHIRTLYNLRDTNRNYTLITLNGTDTVLKKKITTPLHYKLGSRENRALLVDKEGTVKSIDIRHNQLDITEVHGKRTGDSIRISFNYPFDEPVHYHIYKGKRLVTSGEKNNFVFTASDQSKDEYSILFTTNLHQRIEDNFYRITFVPEAQQLHFTHNIPKDAFPGAELNIDVQALDYKNKPAGKVSITANAVNAQFADKLDAPVIDVPEKYMNKVQIKPETSYATANLSLNTLSIQYKLKNDHFRRFNLRKNEYYLLKYPEEDYAMVEVKKQQYNPELCIVVTNQHNMYSPKYVLLDGQPVYISDLNSQLAYSVLTTPGVHDISFRYFNRRYDLKQLMLKPGTKYIIGINIDSVIKKAKRIQYSDTMSAFEPTPVEKDLLYNTLLVTNQFGFEELSLSSEMTSSPRYNYRKGSRMPVLNIDGDYYYVFGPLASNAKTLLRLDNTPHELKNSTFYVHHYDPILKGFKSKTFGKIKGAVFNFTENQVTTANLLQLQEADTQAYQPEKLNMRINQDAREAQEETIEDYYQSYVSPKGQDRFYIRVFNSTDSIFVKSLWIISQVEAEQCDYIQSVARVQEFSYTKAGQNGKYDVYVLLNNGRLSILRDVNFYAQDEWYLNPAYLKTEKQINEKLDVPLRIYAELTRMPLQPFYDPPIESKDKIKTGEGNSRYHPYLHGLITGGTFEPVADALIYLEINGRYKYGAVTNERGEFEIADMIPGTYQVKIYNQAFQMMYFQPMLFEAGKKYDIITSLIPRDNLKPYYESIQNDLHFMAFVKDQQSDLMQTQLFDKDTRAPIYDGSIKLFFQGELINTFSLHGKYNLEFPFPLDDKKEYTMEVSKEGYIPLVLRNMQFKNAYYYVLHAYLTPEKSAGLFKRKEFYLSMYHMPEYETVQVIQAKENSTNQSIQNCYDPSLKGSGEIFGRVTDEVKVGIKNVSVRAYQGGVLKGTASTDSKGTYRLRPLGTGQYDIKMSHAGYTTLEIIGVTVGSDQRVQQNFSLTKKAALMANEVTLTEYKVEADAPSPTVNATISRSEVNRMPTAFTSDLTSATSATYANTIGSLSMVGDGGVGTVFLVDGVMVRDGRNIHLPGGATGNGYEDTERFRKGEGDLYADGNMIEDYTQSNTTGGIRRTFSDVGYWAPKLLTDKQGKAHFTVRLPDNITNWKSYIVGMDRKWRHGIDSAETRAYKPLQVNSIVPPYLYDQDKVWAKARFQNLTKDLVRAGFAISVNGVVKHRAEDTMRLQYLDSILLHADGEEKMAWEAALNYKENYKDAEQLSIPVFSTAMKYHYNRSLLMEKDSIYQISFPIGIKGNMVLNNQLYEKVMEHIKALDQYTYGCVEQTASKLKALLFQEMIHSSLSIKEKKSAEINRMIGRLSDYQNTDGSWGWWRKQSSDARMTTYAMEVLYMASQYGYNNNGYLLAKDFLSGQLKYLSISDKLYAMYVLLKMGHSAEQIRNEFNGIGPDVLRATDQMYYYKLKHQLGQAVNDNKLYALFQEMNKGAEQQYSDNFFYDTRSDIFNAYALFEGTPMADDYLRIFRTRLKNGQLEGSLNTFSRASLIEALARNAMKEGPTAIQAEISVNDTLKINSFPYVLPLQAGTYYLRHKGGEVFLNTNEEQWTRTPSIHDSVFAVRTSFIQNNRTTDTLIAGDACQMKVMINVYRSGEHVMVEVPIPSGMRVMNKAIANSGKEYIEYQKNKVVYFFTKLPMGLKELTLDLQPSFRGEFILPATKVSLMYYPFVYGNNVNRTLVIR